MSRKNINRRKFIKSSACAAMTSIPFLSTALDLALINSLAAGPSMVNGDFKALVCIGLFGGLDSYNMLIPRGDSYENYAETRGSLAINLNDLEEIEANNGGNKSYGLYPGMTEAKELFDDGNLAFVSNIGTLVDPLSNATNYNDESYRKPLHLYSHVDQYKQWQTSVPLDPGAYGWGGRIADILHSSCNLPNFSMNISLAGYNIFQNSATTREFNISNQGNGTLSLNQPFGAGNSGFIKTLQESGMNNILESSYTNIFEKALAAEMFTTSNRNKEFADVIGLNPPFTSPFSTNKTSQDLKIITKTIQAQAALGLNRQIFFLSFENTFDSHSNLNNSLGVSMPTLSKVLKEFYTALEEIGMQDKVTTFTISDFGRTLTTNGNNGTDHAWAGNQIVMGGDVKGKDVYGTYPNLTLEDNPVNISPRGVLIPTTSTDEYFAELALWFGVPQGQLSEVFPNIHNFYPMGSTDRPVGFMKT